MIAEPQPDCPICPRLKEFREANREKFPGWFHAPVPGFGPKLLFGGELVDELLLASQRVLPERLTESGYTFAQPELGPALRSLLSPDAG